MDSKGDETETDNDATIPEPSQESTKRVYKSWRKKYRKMRYLFDDGMRESASLFKQEHKAWDIARRLQQQNDQLLDLLVEFNDSPTTPSFLRYQLGSPPPRLADIPELESDHSDELSKNDSDDFNSLQTLINNATHTHGELPQLEVLPPDLQDWDETLPPSYLTPEHENKVIAAQDATINAPITLDEESDEEEHWYQHERNEPLDKDMALKNPVSVHNWLRRNLPQVFENAEKAPKSTPEKANNRKSRVAKEEPLDPLDDEIGFDPRYDGIAVSARGKRKNDDDAYRPKGGGSRSKRKRDKDDSEIKPAKRPRKSGLSVEVNDAE